jgi:exoribonuclease R
MIHLNINEIDFTAFLYKSHLKPDRYRFARNKHALVGQFSKKTYKVGDELKTYIEKVDIFNQEIFLSLSKSK